MKQINEIGGKVKKGEKAHMVCFYTLYEKEDPKTGETITIPVFRYYRVFEVSQCEGVNRKIPIEEYNHDPIQKAEEIIHNFKDCPNIVHHPNKAFYRPSEDIIGMPSINQFEKPEEYYSTLFHELVHSTGHPKRLNRQDFMKHDFFGDENYSKEELVAEFGASFLCAIAGIENVTINNSATYIKGWMEALKNDVTLAVKAASLAQKA
jgi:antirestriction protein ArdC